jgi:hypothetical protein
MGKRELRKKIKTDIEKIIDETIYVPGMDAAYQIGLRELKKRIIKYICSRSN